jgi:hypothetical protein
MDSVYTRWIHQVESLRSSRAGLPIEASEYQNLVKILSPVTHFLEELGAKGYVGSPMAKEVAQGIGFVWAILPAGSRLEVHCFGPVTHEGAFIRIGIRRGEIEWRDPPPVVRPGVDIESIVRYPAPDANRDVAYSHGRLLDIIAKLVGDPLSA